VHKTHRMKHLQYYDTVIKLIILLLVLFFIAPGSTVQAENSRNGNSLSTQAGKEKSTELKTLETLYEVRQNLRDEIKIKTSELKASLTESEKKQITRKLNRLSEELANIENNFEQIATGLNAELNEDKPVEKFNLRDDLGSLIQPIVKEMKHATSDIRQKTRLRDEISFYSEKYLQAGAAAENLNILISQTKDKKLLKQLKALHERWSRKKTQAKSNQKAAELQLQAMVDEGQEKSFLLNSQDYLKSFFRQRGLYLSLGVLSVVLVLLFSRLFYKYLLSRVIGRASAVRNFRQRLVELVHRVFTVALAIMAPMAVFYIAEDWLLFSLGLLLLFGLAWTLKYTIPKMWSQMLLMLNVGPVREGERIVINDLPWRVKDLNVYTLLENPTADLKMRVPIEQLVGKVSRPIGKGEPWFPCKKSDWVILSDGVRGKVVGLSHEMVELVERGGARVNYQMADFLSQSPRNISQSFRLKEILGISYDLQRESTTTVLEKLDAYIREQMAKEGYLDDLMNMRVEFKEASASSLDIVVIADFKGAQAPVYNRIRRAIRRWTVDACSKYHWEIPFTQVVLHQAED